MKINSEQWNVVNEDGAVDFGDILDRRDSQQTMGDT